MTRRSSWGNRSLARSTGAAFIALITLALLLPGGAMAITPPEGVKPAPGDMKSWTTRLAPTGAQLSAVQRLGARATWNDFGTPLSLIRDGGYLATGLQGADAVSVARSWVTANRALFRLDSVTSTNLVLLNDSPMVGSNGHAVLFRQRFGDLEAADDGMITVGITGTRASGWRIAYVSSSAAGTQAAPQPATLSATAAWIKAAAHLGKVVAPAALSATSRENSWTTFTVEGFTDTQRVRQGALPIPGRGVFTVWEANVMDVRPGQEIAYTVFVDARTGAVLKRSNRLDHLADEPLSRTAVASQAPNAGVFVGNTGDPSTGTPAAPQDTECGDFHRFTVDPDVQAIDIGATGAQHDIVLRLWYLDGSTWEIVASLDSIGSQTPEFIHYAPEIMQAGTYAAQVCRFTEDEPAHFAYEGFFSASTADASPIPFPPKWKFFRANPPLNRNSTTDTRVVGCWVKSSSGSQVSECTASYPELDNTASRAPWDHNVQTNLPSFTTMGNNAITAEAWLSPLTPAEPYRPVSFDRRYIYEWTDSWNTSKCGWPTVLGPTGNFVDRDAAIAHLFAYHNRVHDWSYYLGFTERNYNMQVNNFGRTAPGAFPLGREGDPEVGNAQAGAGLPAFSVSAAGQGVTNRNNANQITNQDGVPGITNQYLFQPLASLAYYPCADGDFDGGVVGHEYTHAISNRMVGGPDANLTGHQARAMGESWSDQVGLEMIVQLNDVPAGQNPWVVGPYATGNTVNGIRNYPINNSPLNYSQVGYDSAHPSVHADGEIWNATGYDIRQALVAKYNASYPATNTALQLACARGERAVTTCPGNRRWMQIVFDAWLLQPANVSMLGARDTYLAADLMRFGGANQRELWTVFARRGFGSTAFTIDNADTDPKPSFRVPDHILTATNQSSVQFVARNENGAPITNARIYVGVYEARTTPIADTRPADTDTTTPEYADRALFVPGTYQFLAVAPGYGFLRSPAITLTATDRVITFNMTTNWASKTSGGAHVAATSEGVQHNDLIDDTETTNWGVKGKTPNIDGSKITIDLGGGAHLVNRVQVSALGHPPGTAASDSPQGRFVMLRSFHILACNGTAAHCASDANFTKISSDTTVNGLTGTIDAFPGQKARPIAPRLNLRSFNVRPTMATHIRLVVVKNQCTGNPDFQGQQTNDPLAPTDCRDGGIAPLQGGPSDNDVRAAELQVFGGTGSVSAPGGSPPVDPVVALTLTGPASGTRGSTGTYTLTYRNLGPATASSAKLEALLPATLGYVTGSASNSGTYSSSTRKVTWNLGNVAAGATGTRTFKGKIGSTVPVGTVILTQGQFTAPLTYSNPAAWVTVVSP